MKTLHICPLDKFIPPFVEFMKENYEIEKHLFILIGDLNKYPVQLDNNVIHVKSISRFFQIIRKMQSAQKIILHSIFPVGIVLLLASQPWLLKKCYWVMWGGDLYYYKFRKRDIKNNLYEAVRRFVIKRIGHFVTYIKGDYELAQKWYSVKGEYHECLLYRSNVFMGHAKPKKASINTCILAGHSADQTNNHLDIFEKLLPYKNLDILIYCPLSYGAPAYADHIKKQGYEMFGEKFIPISSFMTIEKYMEFLNEIDIAIFAHQRQQAMGNIITLLGLGKRLYLRNDTSHWDFFSAIGVNVFDVEDFDIAPLEEKLSKSNQEIISNYFSDENLSKQVNELFMQRDV